jgi:hypothetical protein
LDARDDRGEGLRVHVLRRAVRAVHALFNITL